jgi:hypothetical protein
MGNYIAERNKGGYRLGEGSAGGCTTSPKGRTGDRRLASAMVGLSLQNSDKGK